MVIGGEGLESRLIDRFGGGTGEARVVVRAIEDLAESGEYAADVGIELTADIVLRELDDAPEGSPAERWNWWIGSLETAFGGYVQFSIRRYRSGT